MHQYETLLSNGCKVSCIVSLVFSPLFSLRYGSLKGFFINKKNERKDMPNN